MNPTHTERLTVKQFKTFQKLMSAVAKLEAQEELQALQNGSAEPLKPSQVKDGEVAILGAQVKRQALKPSMQLGEAIGQINELKNRLEQYLERKLEPGEEVGLKSVKQLKMAITQAEQDFKNRLERKLHHTPSPKPEPPKGA